MFPAIVTEDPKPVTTSAGSPVTLLTVYPTVTSDKFIGAVKSTVTLIDVVLGVTATVVEALWNSIHPDSGLSVNLESSSFSQLTAKTNNDNKKILYIFFIFLLFFYCLTN